MPKCKYELEGFRHVRELNINSEIPATQKLQEAFPGLLMPPAAGRGKHRSSPKKENIIIDFELYLHFFFMDNNTD